jgi:hypothetical protein
MRTSQNPQKAKFAESPFHALRRLGARTRTGALGSGPRPTLCRLQGILLTIVLIAATTLLECIPLSGDEVEYLVTQSGIHKV